ncbi:MAG: 23S rRNA (adenine(2030)-N(6))-methyltransferase RlmJ [Ferrovibrio sp.]|uniref:23S rRNA (adenine(2030)-N(6))-methyltransferase RlmJ n=1 Tax=Ferrovibrio sp. TaxID=1917215 RepID=UPI002620BDBE|nr:23S rRNA (adenine(2030)-N(6))-methyltransferase RlmJ [Ferrovibrio sp.]MCW0235594.1 23S rRNA (adenine(2030)-N(6))-methyltransferase RlmJ [Ferrovibrio sp.]
MNYRHAFHAGNFGDVLKHVVLLELLDALHRKPNPVHLIDTHAGIGLYDLAGDEAQRSGEYRFGIGAVLADLQAEKILPRYTAALKRLNPELKPGGSGLRRYPGSPWLLQDSVRPGDRVTLCELHPQDAETLKRNIGRDPAVAIHHRDGFAAIKALLPPTPRRGLALIDPAFEAKDEFTILSKAVLTAQQRWATGQLVVWYPIKDQKSIEAWKTALAKELKSETLCIELTVRPAKDARQMSGSGLLVVNPPWQLKETLAPMLDFLKGRLIRETGGGVRITTLVKAG